MIPQNRLYLLTGKPLVATFVTLLPDGAPHSSLVWFLYEAPYVLVDSLNDSQKARNLRRDPRVGLTVVDTQDPYHYIEMRGVVERMEPDPSATIIDRMGLRYEGVLYYGGEGSLPLDHPTRHQRLTFYIKPLRVRAQ
ncbi:MAG: PPOX class F420-dependent oxidoreductase [Anaerolineae bacterium]|nr:PPOX class F420-dependent oxidoreductase [Anaerolineae bacterium]